MSENSQLNKTYALLKEVYGPLENLSQIKKTRKKIARLKTLIHESKILDNS